ncbi:TPA: hypothetical protein L6A34_31305 [Pseudomonas aeruginosa]|uniref:hypothetical protein n=1 Tax=Pseudomonas aeruginosa TaxID=287 RepID=UPI00071BA6DA|nr:hypothetical protein [Pseudomonas aeruginosa]ELQ8317562.1 hypothetical protein [Pseudomonas aeruginosa]KSM65100.1 hypothetical protein APA70_22155 [Pseudomonas aeruginosa]HBP5961574.1 hypothetical protein [Pseudomonas aeruginosa]HBP6298935.1 hypothetical protein [Pseudomonas aeruginosa]HBP6386409.1 hypothetical protein [Pseudomonas aeruginosa]
MKWLRYAGAIYFAIALYGVLSAEGLPFLTVLYKVCLMLGMIAVLLGWDYIFGGNLSGQKHEEP